VSVHTTLPVAGWVAITQLRAEASITNVYGDDAAV
jgi:hypothetical protein